MDEFLGIEQQLLTLQTFSRFSMVNQLSLNYWVVAGFNEDFRRHLQVRPVRDLQAALR